MDDDESDEIEPEVDAPDDAAPAPDDDAPDDPVDDLLTPVTWKCLCMCALLHKEREREGKHQNKVKKCGRSAKELKNLRSTDCAINLTNDAISLAEFMCKRKT